MSKQNKNKQKPRILHTCNLITRVAKARGLRTGGQPELYIETLPLYLRFWAIFYGFFACLHGFEREGLTM